MGFCSSYTGFIVRGIFASIRAPVFLGRVFVRIGYAKIFLLYILRFLFAVRQVDQSGVGDADEGADLLYYLLYVNILQGCSFRRGVVFGSE